MGDETVSHDNRKIEKCTKRDFDLQGFILDKGFQGTVVNWTLPSLHRRSLDITLWILRTGWFKESKYLEARGIYNL